MKIEDYQEYYIQGSDHYLIPGDVLEDLIEETKEWKDETDNYLIQVDDDLKNLIISALRYAIGKKTYIVLDTCNYIKNHPELIDERVRQVMLKDLEDLDMYYEESDTIDLPVFIELRKWLENYMK